MKEFISEDPKTKYYVQFYCMTEKRWLTVDGYTFHVDAVIHLGKVVEANPQHDHRVLQVNSEVCFEVPSIDTEKGD